jgi:hypothetical protein
VEDAVPHPVRRLAAGALALAAACAAAEHEPPDRERPAVATAARPEPTAPVDTAAERARLDAASAELNERFGRVPPLSPREVAELRRDANATQIASARRLGQRVTTAGERERLRREGRLVPLPDSTEFWILRRMEHSEPLATPDAQAMLEEIGRRFHARLDAAGLPRYRMRITSVLRTDADQAALRRVNRNASSIVSAHEFGTTVDVSHERFAVPAGTWPAGAPTGLREEAVDRLEVVGKEHARALQAELGRAVHALREEGVLHVMMEDAQPVYHMTVARPGGRATTLTTPPR